MKKNTVKQKILEKKFSIVRIFFYVFNILLSNYSKSFIFTLVVQIFGVVIAVRFSGDVEEIGKDGKG